MSNKVSRSGITCLNYLQLGNGVCMLSRHIPDEIVHEIISRNDIVEVISEYVPLQPGGANHRALCPFHNEKTPSFMVSREKQMFKCFGCGKGGDVVGFIMEKENLDFVEALKKLAQRINLQIPEAEMTPQVRQELQEQHQLMDLHRDAASFYFNCLKKRGNAGARYLAGREWSIETIKRFGLGYAPDQWDALCRYMSTKGYSNELLEKAGLAILSEKVAGNKRHYDRFRNRVMFPIFDIRGNVVAFGGRILTPEGTPKYLNSPETLLFNKRHLLYGLNIARTHLRQHTLILVEGYTDVITLHENGFQNAVATLGTSLTPEHAGLAEKTAKRVILCFDGDQAGEQAAQRSIRIFRNTEVEVKILTLPHKTDPDQYVKEKGAEAFEQLLQKAPTAVEYQISLIRRRHSLATVEGKVHFAREASDVLKQIKSMVEREAYAARVAEEIGVSKASFMEELQQGKRSFELRNYGKNKDAYVARRLSIEAMTPVERDAVIKMECLFLKWALRHPEHLLQLGEKIEASLFQHTTHQVLFRLMIENHELLQKNTVKKDFFEGFEEEMANIDAAEDCDLSLEDMIRRFTQYMKTQQRQQQLKQLEEKQRKLLDNQELNPKEKEDEMLKLGMEIRRINIELQELYMQKGGK